MRLLAVDIGNTRISQGLYDGNRLLRRFDTPNEDRAESFARESVGCGLCVVSRVSRSAADFEKYLTDTLSYRVVTLTQADVPFRIHYSAQLGSDRLANAFAARRYAPQGAIVIDLGTATHFDIVDERGDFYGGPIHAGIQTLHDALSMRIPHLPQEPLHRVESVIVENTIEAMNAGALYATAGAIEKISAEIRRQFGANFKTILTGGNATFIRPILDVDFEVPNLTLEGLHAFGMQMMRKSGVRVSA